LGHFHNCLNYHSDFGYDLKDILHLHLGFLMETAMTKLRALLAGVVIAALAFVGGLWAQQLASFTLTGNEVIVAAIGGPGGPSIFVPVGELRNATGLKTFSGSGAQTYQMLPSDSTLFWIGTAPTTWTITTPVTPYDGQILQLATDTTLTTLVTLTPATGQTLQAAFSSQTVTAGTSLEWMYVLATTKWQRIR